MTRFFALVILIACLPLILGICLFLLFYNSGKIFFHQERLGLHQRPFVIYKFRTFRDDQSLSVVGGFLRRSSLDELPQLFNILKGDMNFVGPRPLPVDYLPLHKTEELVRYHVRPGMTGLTQVSGGNALSWDQRFQLDVEYVSLKNVFTDVKIIFRTIPLLFLGKKSESVLLLRPQTNTTQC